MKKFIRYVAVIAIIASFTACGEEETKVQDAPTFSVTATNSSVKVGNTTDVTVNITSAPGKIGSITATASGAGSVSGISAGALAGQTEGSVTGTFTANSVGTATLVVTVVDQQNPALEKTETFTITVTELDPPSISLSAASASADVGAAASVDITFGAEAGLASYDVSVEGTSVAGGALSGASASETFEYTVQATDESKAWDFVVSVTDGNGTSNSSTWTLTVNASTPADRAAVAYAQWNNSVTDPVFAANSIQPGAAASGSTYDLSGMEFFTAADYKGAIDPNAATPWYLTDTWSMYAHILLDVNDKARVTGNETEITVSDDDLNGNGTSDATEDLTAVTWTADNIYKLDGFVFVNDGQTLTIEAGTVIKGLPGAAENASALVVARGGKLMAMGTSAAPIIMTYEADPLDGSTNAATQAAVRGQWGGLIILGKAGLNSANGTTAIEGIPTSEPRGLYGGNTNDDSSGELHYVSIRHGGTDIGAGNEINGLTLGGVGSGTMIDHVEVIGNTDDGIEWFGGTVNSKNMIVAFAGDDALDYDEGYRGLNQFVIVHQDAAAGDRGGEHDGGTSPETGTPYATPYFANVTSVGRATSRTLTFRDNAGGFYINSLFTGFGSGIDIEDLVGEEQDTYKQFLDGNWGIYNCIFNNIDGGAKDTAAELITISN